MSMSENTAIDLARAPAMAKLMLKLFERLTIGTLTVTFPGGGHQVYGGKLPGHNAFLDINDWSACSLILRFGDIGLAEANRDNRINIPDIPALFLMAMPNENALIKRFNGTFGGKIS